MENISHKLTINIYNHLQLTPQHRTLQPGLPIKYISLQRPRIDMPRTQLLNPLAPQQPHSSLSLRLQNLKHPLHTRLTTSSQSKERRPAQPNTLGTQSQGFHNICTALNAAVDPDFKLSQDFRTVLADFEKSVQGWRRGVEGTAAVVREDDALDVLGVV
jgi:hypothetical protein